MNLSGGRSLMFCTAHQCMCCPSWSDVIQLKMQNIICACFLSLNPEGLSFSPVGLSLSPVGLSFIP